MKKRKKISAGLLSAALLWLFACPAFAQVQYPLLFDKTFSARTGAHNIVTLHRGLYGLEGKFLKARWFDEDSFGKKAAGMTYRLAKSILVDYALDHLSFLGQHEVFGHGARYREFGYVDNEFTLNLPPPYGNGRGWASTGHLKKPRITGPHERLGMVLGGSESNAVLSHVLRSNWLQRGSIHYRESILYILSANDLSSYILRTRYNLRGEGGNDVLNYLRTLNSQHGYFLEENHKLTLDDLAARAWINMLDPFLYFSLYAYFKTYLWSGDESVPVPMIKWGGARYLPSFHLGLTPFGPEYYFENLVVKNGRIYDVYLRYGNPTFHKFWGMGAHVMNLVKGARISLDARVDIWNQPPLLLGGERMTETGGGWGGSIQGAVYYRLFKNRPLFHLTAQAGYKTAGFLKGEQLAGGFILRVGISFYGL